MLVKQSIFGPHYPISEKLLVVYVSHKTKVFFYRVVIFSCEGAAQHLHFYVCVFLSVCLWSKMNFFAMLCHALPCFAMPRTMDRQTDRQTDRRKVQVLSCVVAAKNPHLKLNLLFFFEIFFNKLNINCDYNTSPLFWKGA